MNECEIINKRKILKTLKKCSSIIWDFDGVIKDSVDIKGKVFRNLIPEQSKELKDKIYKHHNSNGGISRFNKIKIYLNWSSFKNTEANLNFFTSKFSTLIKKEVIKSNYIDGIYNYLKENHIRQNFYLVTATPQEEIIEITKDLEIFDYFKKIFGHPNSKEDSFKSILEYSQNSSKDFVVIGDSFNEYDAAKKHNLKFILRIDQSKNRIPKWYIEKDLIINNFISE